MACSLQDIVNVNIANVYCEYRGNIDIIFTGTTCRQTEMSDWYFFLPSVLSLSHFKQTIKATSPLGDPRVTYNLEDGMVPETNMPVRFYLTPNREDGSASILVAEPLDYETTRNFMLRVRAQNVAAVPLAAFTMVYVNVTGGPCYNHSSTVY